MGIRLRSQRLERGPRPWLPFVQAHLHPPEFNAYCSLGHSLPGQACSNTSNSPHVARQRHQELLCRSREVVGLQSRAELAGGHSQLWPEWRRGFRDHHHLLFYQAPVCRHRFSDEDHKLENCSPFGISISCPDCKTTPGSHQHRALAEQVIFIHTILVRGLIVLDRHVIFAFVESCRSCATARDDDPDLDCSFLMSS